MRDPAPEPQRLARWERCWTTRSSDRQEGPERCAAGNARCDLAKLWASGRFPAPKLVNHPHFVLAADRDDQRRLITTVPAARSWRPRRSVETIIAGSARDTRNARSSARRRPSGCASSRTTAMRLSSWPKLPPASQDSTVDSTKKTVKIIHARQPPPVRTPEPKNPTATAMHAAQSMINAPTRAFQLASDPRPSRGRPRRCPG